MLFNPELDKSQKGSNKNFKNLEVRSFLHCLEFWNIPGNNKNYVCCREMGNFSVFDL